MMRLQLISMNKTQNRAMVVIHTDHASYTRHLRKEGSRWMGIVTPAQNTRVWQTVQSDKPVYSLSRLVQQGKGSVTQIPLFDYTDMMESNFDYRAVA